MKLLFTIDDSVTEDSSIPSFWYRSCSYDCIHTLKPYQIPVPFAEWEEDNEILNRKRITKP